MTKRKIHAAYVEKTIKTKTKESIRKKKKLTASKIVEE